MKLNYTKKLALLFFACLSSNGIFAQGFSATPQQWNIPTLGSYEYMIAYNSHNVIDFNGDGKPDMIDAGDNGNVFLNGSQKYWKVYLSAGSGFSAVPLQWNIPNLGSYEYMVAYNSHNVIDFNGDGKPDLIDTGDDGDVFVNGSQKYWKVYLNNGSGFNAAPVQWNIPALGSYEYMVAYNSHSVIDFNGDGKPDLIDSGDNGNVFLNGSQKYWKVYLNTGSGFSTTPVQWNIPNLGSYEYMIAYGSHSVIDFNGDGKPDMIDAGDDGDVFVNGTQKYWKVYINTGSGFSATPIQWNIPNIGSYEYMVAYNSHNVIDFNGDGKPDMIDAADNGDVFLNGSQKYWKVYLNTGSGFGATPIQWNIPNLGSYEYTVAYNSHNVIDFNGDSKPDLIDSGDDGNVFLNGSQKYWKVYLNTGSNLSTELFEKRNAFSVYPNPAQDVLNVYTDQPLQEVSIINTLGQQVITKPSNGNHAKIDVSGLAPGIYFAKVTSGAIGIPMQRFLKK